MFLALAWPRIFESFGGRDRLNFSFQRVKMTVDSCPSHLDTQDLGSKFFLPFANVSNFLKRCLLFFFFFSAFPYNTFAI